MPAGSSTDTFNHMSYEFHKFSCEKFTLFLCENNYILDNFTIDKQHARDIYNKTFKQANKVKLSFYFIIYNALHTGLIHRRPKDPKVLYFNKSKVLRVQKTWEAIELRAQQCTSQTKRNIPHDNNNKANKKVEKIVSVKESTPDVLEFSVSGFNTLNNVFLRKNEEKVLNFTLKNISKNTITITSIRSQKNIPGIRFAPKCPLKIPSLSTATIDIKALFLKDGTHSYPIVVKTKDKVTYEANLVFQIHDEFFDDLHPIGHYTRASKPAFLAFIKDIDSGEKPAVLFGKRLKIRLEQYQIPPEVAIALSVGLDSSKALSANTRAQISRIKGILEANGKKLCLQSNNYSVFLNLLLFMEEQQMHKDIREYDVEDQVLIKRQDLFELEIPGLAENRPSVIFGDAVYLREHVQSTTLYQGFVHKVQQNSVLLKFSENFASSVFIQNKKFYASFSFNRYPVRVEHQAVEFAKIDNIAPFLFPKTIRKTPVGISNLNWFNCKIADNPQQKQAVYAILEKSSAPHPYIIFGPPGTGKTMTVVEAVKQIYKLTKDNILICTPSNSAANVVTERLITSIAKRDLHRLIAISYSSAIEENIKPYTNFAHGSYSHPVVKDLLKYRIVITTLVSAAKLVNGGCPSDHFAYVFVDESGQATESETLISFARILSAPNSKTLHGQIVLAGDPRQLGPVIHSNLAKLYGLDISMLERLIDNCPPYKRDASNKYNPNAITKLLKNYRSHPDIIHSSNELFYKGELEIAGDESIRIGEYWSALPNPKFPVIFHNVVGLDQRERNSPSFFNIQEIEVVVNYMSSLIGSRLQGRLIKETDIAIISPYRKQVEKLRKACLKKNYNNLLICSVEQIQGQEKLIICITNVRSRLDLVKFDKRHHLGFLDNPKRFNVAVTRAKALLIVVGNGNILSYNKNWRTLINYCKINNSIKGAQFNIADENFDQVLNDLESLEIDGAL